MQIIQILGLLVILGFPILRAILLIESIQEHGAVTVFTSVFRGLLTLIIGIAIFAIIGLILDWFALWFLSPEFDAAGNSLNY